MFRLYSFTILFFIISISQVKGQVLFLSPEETFNEAIEYIKAEDPKEALPLFFELIQKGYNTATIDYYIGKCYLKIQGMKKMSVSYLERASKKISKDYKGTFPNEDFSPVQALFLLGEAYQVTNQLDKSIQSFKTYMEYADDETEKNSARLKIRQCENAKDIIEAAVEVKTIKINNEAPAIRKFNAVLSSDEENLFFMEEFKFYDAVKNSIKLSDGWSESVNITARIKSDGDYYITGISPDGKTLFLYTYNNYTKGDIYSTTCSGETWSELKKLNSNINTSFEETHASLSPDGNILYFTSNRPGGYGGIDIYKSEKGTDGEWGPARNLGPIINTHLNEETPFISSDNRILYFSSQGHYNMGGYDIFSSELKLDNSWQVPLNMGYPLNTTDDNKFYFPVGNGRSGYISQLDHETADIVKYTLLGFSNPARFKVKGDVSIPEGSHIKKDEIMVSFVEKQNNEKISEKRCDTSGLFSQKLPAGDFLLNFTSGEHQLDKKELFIPATYELDEIIYEANLIFDVPDTEKTDTFLLRAILFEFDMSVINGNDKTFLVSLTDLLKKFNGIKIEVNGYTDSKGSEDYNYRLSLSRAGEVEDYLISAGINKARIKTRGLGEESPVAKNINDDGSDNPEGRKYNRRVEVILTNIPGNLVIKTNNNIPQNIIVSR